jgi:hypothetical protein
MPRRRCPRPTPKQLPPTPDTPSAVPFQGFSSQHGTPVPDGLWPGQGFRLFPPRGRRSTARTAQAAARTRPSLRGNVHQRWPRTHPAKRDHSDGLDGADTTSTAGAGAPGRPSMNSPSTPRFVTCRSAGGLLCPRSAARHIIGFWRALHALVRHRRCRSHRAVTLTAPRGRSCTPRVSRPAVR